MDLKKFTKEYEKKNILEIYPLIKEIFQEKLSEEFLDEFDPVDILIDLFDECKKFKQFDKEIEIAEIVKEHHQEIFQEAQQYIDDDLIDYYLYHNQKENLEQSVNNFISNPVETIDYFLQVFKKLVFYNYIDLANRMVIECFKEIDKSPRLIGGATEELKKFKFYLAIEEMLEKEKVIDFKKLTPELAPFDIQPSEEGLFYFNLKLDEAFYKNLNELFQTNKHKFFAYIEMNFFIYMKEYNFSFPLTSIISGNIFALFFNHSNKKETNSNKYFSLKKEKFDRFLGEISGGLFADNFSEVFATLWGSHYFYDFLKSINFIDKDVHKSIVETISSLKNELMTNMKDSLWQYIFVTQWSKPDSMTDQTYNKEKSAFIESYSLVPKTKSKKEDLFSLVNGGLPPILKELLANSEEVFKDTAKIAKPKKKKK